MTWRSCDANRAPSTFADIVADNAWRRQTQFSTPLLAVGYGPDCCLLFSIPAKNVASCMQSSQAACKVRKCTLCTAMRNVQSQDPPLQILTATFLCSSSCGRAQQTYAQATVGQDILLNFAAGLFRTASWNMCGKFRTNLKREISHGEIVPPRNSPPPPVLGLCWLLRGSFDCVRCPHTSVLRPSTTCLAAFPDPSPTPPKDMGHSHTHPSPVHRRCRSALLGRESGTVVPLPMGAASAPPHPSRTGAGDASQSVTPKTVTISRVPTTTSHAQAIT